MFQEDLDTFLNEYQAKVVDFTRNRIEPIIIKLVEELEPLKANVETKICDNIISVDITPSQEYMLDFEGADLTFMYIEITDKMEVVFTSDYSKYDYNTLENLSYVLPKNNIVETMKLMEKLKINIQKTLDI